MLGRLEKWDLSGALRAGGGEGGQALLSKPATGVHVRKDEAGRRRYGTRRVWAQKGGEQAGGRGTLWKPQGKCTCLWVPECVCLSCSRAQTALGLPVRSLGFCFVVVLSYKVFQLWVSSFHVQGRKEGPSLSAGKGVRRLQEERLAEVVSEENGRLPGNHTRVLSHVSSQTSAGVSWLVRVPVEMRSLS